MHKFTVFTLLAGLALVYAQDSASGSGSGSGSGGDRVDGGAVDTASSAKSGKGMHTGKAKKGKSMGKSMDVSARPLNRPIDRDS